MKRDDLPTGKANDGVRVVERRSGKDRRKTDVSTMGPLDRRKRVEPRKIQVVEVEMSESEWEALFGKRKD
ncbi:MAG: hypothetical protein QM739_02205 [Propionivibrio sp.]